MTKQEFITWAKSRGWTEDKFGHLQKTKGEDKYRFKLSSTSARYEKQLHLSDSNEWLRIRSGYFKSLSINNEGKIKGLK